MEMLFQQLNPHACRTYLAGRQGSSEVILIDPVLEHVDEYMELLDKKKLNLTHVIDTHTHADHISAGAVLKDLTGCGYVMHTKAPAHCVTFRLIDGFECHFGEIPVKVMHTPGHTKDSVSLIFPDRILTGDVLFLDDGGAGRDDLPGGDPGEHWESLQRILELPDHLVVYPAHEYRNRQPSSLGEQKQRNPHLKPRTKEEYIDYLDGLKLGPAEWMKDVLKANYACARDPKAAWIPVDVPACEVKGTLEHGVNDQQVASIPVGELKRRLDTDKAPVLLDVRESEELKGELGHLPGIKHVPIGDLSKRVAELEAGKDKEVVTVCKSGGRAHTAAQILMQAGFKHVYVLAGGMTAWSQTTGI
jgi:glyoxylase-like metal-dependent hydrolase (beta-lactamase superfamily II)/rhodanese-related sulfurtransferase